jgi:hypothetical protein
LVLINEKPRPHEMEFSRATDLGTTPDRFLKHNKLCLERALFQCLFRFDPGIRACQFNGYVRKEDVQGLAIGGASVLR